MPRSTHRAFAAVSAVTIAALALTGCTQAPSSSKSNCAGLISKVLTTDDSATTVTPFAATDVPKIFAVPASPAPTCYYVTTSPPAPVNGVTYVQTQRTLLYIGLSDSQSAAIIAAIRKTVSVAPWTVRFDYGAPVPAAGATPTAAPASASSSARWYYNFNAGPTDNKGEMGYFATTPLSQGTAIQAGLPKAENVLRVELELKEPKK